MPTHGHWLARRAGPALLLAAAVLPFTPALGGPFLYDDFPAILKNPSVRGGGIGDLFTTGSYWRERSVGYRPLATLSFRAGRALWGEAPAPEHAVNVALHAANALLVWVLARRLIGPAPALAAGLLFAAHPVQAEAVCGIAAGRAELLAAFFSLVALAVASRRPGRAWSAPLWGALYLAALLSKESALLLPAFLLIVEGAVDGARAAGRPSRRTGRAALRVALAAALPLALYLTLRRGVLGRLGGALPARLDNPLAYVPGAAYAAGALRVLSEYVRLFLFPRRLSIDYGFDAVPLPARLADPSLLPAAASMVALLALASRRLRARLHPAAPSLAIALSASLLIPCQALGPIPALCAERFLYLPAAFAAMLAAALLFPRGTPRPGPLDAPRRGDVAAGSPGTLGPARAAALALLLAAAVGRSATRAADWRSEIRLFASSLAAAPRSARLHNVLGLAYWNSGRHEEAEREYRASLAIDPGYGSALVNFGNALMARGDAAGARENYERALAADPGHALARWNLAVALERCGDPAAAAREYAALAASDPGHFDARLRLGELLVLAGRDDDARRVLGEALALRPGDPGAMRALAEIESRPPSPPR